MPNLRTDDENPKPYSNVGRIVRVAGRDESGVVLAWGVHFHGARVVVIQFHDSGEVAQYVTEAVVLVD